MSAPRACDFCGKSAPEVSLSREHIFAQSLRDTVTRSQEHTYRRAYQQSGDIKGDHQTRPVDMFDVVSRRICTKCNNGWMSELEDEANPLLRVLIAGGRQLSPDNCQTLRRWLAKTAIVSHFAEPDSDNPAAVDPADRQTVHEGGVPAAWRFLVGTLDPSWRHHRHRGVVRGPKDRVVDGRTHSVIFHFASIEIGCFIGCVIGCPPWSDAGPAVTDYLAGGMRHCYPFFEDITVCSEPLNLSRTGNPPHADSLNELAVTFVEGLLRVGE